MQKKEHFTKMLLLFLLLACCPFARATNVQFMQLVVKGNQVIVALSEHPAITYVGNSLHIATKDKDIDVAVADITYFGFSDTEQSVVGIELTKGSLPKLSSGQLVFTQLKVNSTVDVYTADGRKVSAQSVNDNGMAIVNLNNLAKGTYIVKTATQTIKVTNK